MTTTKKWAALNAADKLGLTRSTRGAFDRVGEWIPVKFVPNADLTVTLRTTCQTENCGEYWLLSWYGTRYSYECPKCSTRYALKVETRRNPDKPETWLKVKQDQDEARA